MSSDSPNSGKNPSKSTDLKNIPASAKSDNEKQTTANAAPKGAGKPSGAAPPSAPSKPPGKPPGPIPPTARPSLFRRIDWITFFLTTILILIGYVLTLAPEVTLEDSGELAVGSFYAGVPHPPGYPVWTMYTWLFTVLVPFSNIAWRVGLSSAVAGSVACGLLALLVSRGSSMMLEGIADLRNIDKKVESWICLVSGFVAGMLLGFNGFMWSQAVIVEVYPFSVLSFIAVLCCLLRWLYAPDQRRYAYWAAFLFGICITNHQTLIVAAMGIEVVLLMGQPKLGRDLFLANGVIYILGLIAKSKGIITSFDQNGPLFAIYNVIGIGSILTCAVVTLRTKQILTEWKPVLIMAAVWGLGAAFYFYMPIASMTNPPMNWGYPRTVEGFWHALTRGQYDKTNPTADIFRFFSQIRMHIEGAVEEFNFVYLLIGLLPFVFYRRLQKRERAWLIGLSGIYLCLSVLLMILLNPNTDRQAREQAKVFFIFSHCIMSLGVGYGLTLIGGSIAVQYATFRRIALWGAAVACGIALYALVDLKTQFPLDKATAIVAFSISIVAVVIVWIYRERPPIFPMLAIFAVMPVHSILSHWSDNEQRGHLFGYWFGHDMFTPPYKIYPEMAKDAVLFGGTDPGRFNPTYMIFCESFIPPSKKPLDPAFNRRDVYLITQNALADGTYLSYIRAHYNRSTQIDPPFFQEFVRSQREIEDGRTNILSKMLRPLDNFFENLGAKIEARRRKEGVYPLTEISTPSVADSQQAFQDYIADAQRRLQHDMQNPNEPKQIKPGEDVRVVDNRISVSGQVAVMAINGLLTKVIFDHNPNHEFYVEESFPLDWMFPYLSPFGIIMKINRQPVPEFTEGMINQDHSFWSQYSQRLIGNWITYDTPVSNICNFAEKVYLRRDFSGFTGDRKFIRDDNAQKAFSKLRSAIGGLYFWRISNVKSPVESQRLFKEAEFALKQSLAFCPYSPEAVFKYVNLLVNLGRVNDAKLVVDTCLKFDPENAAMHGLRQNLADIERGQSGVAQAQVQAGQLEQQLKSNPTNIQVAFQLASIYLQLGKTNNALQLFDQLVANPKADATTLLSVAPAYQQLHHPLGMVTALEKLTTIMPDNAEVWYDLSRGQVLLNKIPEALKSLAKAVQLSNQRLVQQPGSKSLAAEAVNDPTFASLAQNPEFQKIVSPPKP